MPECIWVYNNKQDSTQHEVPLQVDEYLLKDRRIQDPVKDIRWSTLEK